MAAKKKTTSTNLSAFIHQGTTELAKQTPAQRGIRAAVKETTEKTTKPNRERFTVNLPPDLIEWARRAVVHTLGLTLSGLMEEALTKELSLRERKNGEAFPTSARALKRGRPVRLKGGVK
jgi:hypothetical protein